MHTPSEPRFRKRIPCRVRVSGSDYAGMVLNVSRGGLFVQTSAGASPGEEVEVALSVASGAPIALAGRVVWKRVVAARMRAFTHGGMGLRIRSAPETYYRFLLGVSRGDASGAPERAARAPATPQTRRTSPEGEAPAHGAYRVRVQQLGSARSRLIDVAARSERDARRRALLAAGRGWIVLSVERR